MPNPLIIDTNQLDDPRDAIHRAVQGIVEGRLVVLPTETSYCFAASALNPGAVKKIVDLRGSQVPIVPLRSADEALDYLPEFPALLRRLTRRCWPGPLLVLVADHHGDSVLQRIPEEVRDIAFPGGHAQLTVSLNAIIGSILRLMPGPLLLWPAAPPHAPEPVAVPEVMQHYAGKIDLVIDEGRCRFAQPASVVRVDEQDVEVVRPGMISAPALKRFAGYMVALVCTGNTCRSPMAEQLLKKHVAEHLGCKIDELEDHGVLIASAGIAAMSGGQAAEHAVEVMQSYGLDLSTHESQPLTDRVVRYADLIITMTRGHREAIINQWPESRDRVFTIGRDQGDVSDPIGGPIESYQRCAQQLSRLIQEWLPELDLPTAKNKSADRNECRD